MTQEDPVKKARTNAYLTSGTILLLSLLVFFYLHKEQDDKAQKQIATLQSQLADTQKENQSLKFNALPSNTKPAIKPETKPQPKQLVQPQPIQEAPPPLRVVEPKVERQEVEVYITRTGAKYHRDGCQYLSRSQIPSSKKDAIARGFGACSRCNP